MATARRPRRSRCVFCASVAAAAITGLASTSALAQGAISDLPRNETLMVEDPEGTIKNAGWFNIWAINAGGQSTGLHQMAMDT
jgi:peptide/nickel transport system substrate-binding protein